MVDSNLETVPLRATVETDKLLKENQRLKMKVMRMEKWLEEMPTWMKCYNKQFIQEQEALFVSLQSWLKNLPCDWKKSEDEIILETHILEPSLCKAVFPNVDFNIDASQAQAKEEDVTDYNEDDIGASEENSDANGVSQNNVEHEHSLELKVEEDALNFSKVNYEDISENKGKPKSQEKESQDRSYSCFMFECSFVSSKHSELRRHRKIVHGFDFGTKHYACNVCAYVGRCTTKLRSHVDGVHRGRRHACLTCDKAFAYRSGLDKHVRAIHDRVTYNCRLCSFSSCRSDSLNEHVNNVHSGGTHNGKGVHSRFYCDQCPHSVTSKAVLASHMRNNHGGAAGDCKSEKPRSDRRLYQCDQCVYTTQHPTNLKQHMGAQHEGRLFKCDQCSHVTKYRESLKNHIQAIHNKIKHKCADCDQLFTKTGLIRHRRIVTKKKDDRKYSCDICGMVVCLERNLKRHKALDHPTAKIHPCDECDKVFIKKQQLSLHKKFIHRMFRLKCSNCDKEFKSNKALKHHVKIRHNPL